MDGMTTLEMACMEASAFAEKLGQYGSIVRQSIVCCLLDEVAKLDGVSTVELLERLAPVIADINELFGEMEV